MNEYNRIVLIPAYKPDNMLIKTAVQLYDKGFRIIIVNDGSGREFDNVFLEVQKYAVMKADGNMMLRCIKTGLPIAVQNGLIFVSMTALQRVTNGFGENVMAAYTVSMRIEQFVQQPFSSLNAAVSTFTRQNIGAGKSERAVKDLRSAMKISTVFAFVVLMLFILFGRQLTACFVSGDNVIYIASRAIVMTGCFYWALGIIHTVRGFLNGAGDTGYALVNGFAEVICRIGLSLLLTSVSFIGYWGIWLTTCCTWFVTAAVSVIRYKSGRWKDKAVK
ncbi:MAG: MATE family efflux transporter [Huintestinicola sp.]